MMTKKIKNALISVFDKDGLDVIVKKLDSLGIQIYSTGGTYDFVKSLGVNAFTVESLTSYPSILGGRVKTLHPKVFGGILARRENTSDIEQLNQYEIPEIDLVIVDLYPFEKTLASQASDSEIIEKIDIGGISLIRAAAKNFKDVLIVPSVNHYQELLRLLNDKSGASDLEDRKRFAAYAFNVSSHYDSAIFGYFNQTEQLPVFKKDIQESNVLRYGENPHQKGIYFGNFEGCFNKLNGKEVSYNNLLDIDAAVSLISDFKKTSFAIIKHNNACGLASDESLVEAWKKALAGDPVSAFGGILITNSCLDEVSANEINQLFFEIIIAPDYCSEALEILKSKKNRIILKQNPFTLPEFQFKSALNGVLFQEKDLITDQEKELKSITSSVLTHEMKRDLAFANTIAKHTKSNAIVLAKNEQLIGSGTGQTSRVDALKQAIEKAKAFNFDLTGAVMASDAFFPFSDCVEIAHNAGIKAVIHPGGSLRDQDSIDYCETHQMAMVITGHRHFKH